MTNQTVVACPCICSRAVTALDKRVSISVMVVSRAVWVPPSVSVVVIVVVVVVVVVVIPSVVIVIASSSTTTTHRPLWWWLG